jgi:hypothetical protein
MYFSQRESRLGQKAILQASRQEFKGVILAVPDLILCDAELSHLQAINLAC